MSISYESVLGKSESVIDVFSLFSEELNDQRILVTGAGGSIGSKIVEKLSNFPSLQILATDRDENRLHSLSLEMLGSALFNSSDFKVLDVRDQTGVRAIVESFKPTMVIHAAALKHLAILENQPREAYLTNVLGTKNVLDAAEEFTVDSFLNISTDKAANPISVLGKSKAITERLTKVKRDRGLRRYTSVRFGNVFNSRGSVIETFVKQIELQIPITLTHPEVKRYFMKIEEAASLSLASVIIAKGDVHILDMGKPVKLSWIVNRLQELLAGNSEVKIVGLRDGEKLEEELWSKTEVIKDTNIEGIRYLDFGNSRQEYTDRDFDLNPKSDTDAKFLLDKLLGSN